ncbi:MAG TPA: hypothetical protein VIQ27_16960 [Gemmatimonadales bacterium]|jgi:hypothetical protein
MRTPAPLVLAVVAALLGCGDTTESSSPGRILVTVSTRGAPPQSDEYLLTLNGSDPLSVTPNGSASYEEVPEGTYVVHLFSLADNCVVSGSSNQRSVEVRDGEVAAVSFSVLCSVPETGGFHIVVSTTGTPLDADGYQLSVAGTPLRGIEVNAEETYEGLAPGAHLVTLKDVADFCEVLGGNPQPYTVVPGKSVRVAIDVSCGEGGGPS